MGLAYVCERHKPYAVFHGREPALAVSVERILDEVLGTPFEACTMSRSSPAELERGLHGR